METCAKTIVDGFEKRSARVYVPRTVAAIYWLRSLITSGAAERVMTKESAELIPQMEREIAALGRSSSARATEINHLESRSATTTAIES